MTIYNGVRIPTADEEARNRQLSYGDDRSDPEHAGQVGWYSDPSTHLAISKGYFIEIYHPISENSIFFKAFLTDFSDNFAVNYNKTSVFGRSDAITTYQNTERVINVAWDLVSSNLKEAKQNMVKANHLIAMMYPSYDGDEASSASNMKSGPIFKVKMGNLICKPDLSEQEGTSNAALAGLTCTIGGFKYSPVIDDGFFDPKPGIFYPQTIKIDLELSVLHDVDLGWDGAGKPRTKKVAAGRSENGQVSEEIRFPYGGSESDSSAINISEDTPSYLLAPRLGIRLDADGNPEVVDLTEERDLTPGEIPSPVFVPKSQRIIEGGSFSALVQNFAGMRRDEWEMQTTKVLRPFRGASKLFGTQESFTDNGQ